MFTGTNFQQKVPPQNCFAKCGADRSFWVSMAVALIVAAMNAAFWDMKPQNKPAD